MGMRAGEAAAIPCFALAAGAGGVRIYAAVARWLTKGVRVDRGGDLGARLEHLCGSGGAGGSQHGQRRRWGPATPAMLHPTHAQPLHCCVPRQRATPRARTRARAEVGGAGRAHGSPTRREVRHGAGAAKVDHVLRVLVEDLGEPKVAELRAGLTRQKRGRSLSWRSQEAGERGGRAGRGTGRARPPTTPGSRTLGITPSRREGSDLRRMFSSWGFGAGGRWGVVSRGTAGLLQGCPAARAPRKPHGGSCVPQTKRLPMAGIAGPPGFPPAPTLMSPWTRCTLWRYATA
jgi:hypothetical protein